VQIKFIVILISIVLTMGCASSPVAPEGVAIAPVGPAHVLAEDIHDGELVIWGGRVVEIENLSDSTELAVVSYPLNRSDQPRLDAEPGVRFLVVQPGFLEPLTFGPGRFVTVLGRVGGLRERLVGDFTYTYPVIEAEEIHLWPANPELWSNRTRWNFGIGIQL